MLDLPDFLLREWVNRYLRQKYWITSPQIPSRFLEDLLMSQLNFAKLPGLLRTP
jgi:hypothetical protein